MVYVFYLIETSPSFCDTDGVPTHITPNHTAVKGETRVSRQHAGKRLRRPGLLMLRAHGNQGLLLRPPRRCHGVSKTGLESDRPGPSMPER